MKISTIATLAAGGALLASCATGPGDARHDALTVMERHFKAQGIAGVDRLKQDELQAACNKHGDNPPKELATKLQNAQYAAIKWPADGKVLGDWKAGEKTAQTGGAMAWNDKGGVGGSCYNCHQVNPATTSFGTIGPSLN